jgi:hypothetical protein
VLPYGETLALDGYSCLSEESGVTCTGSAGSFVASIYGFEIDPSESSASSPVGDAESAFVGTWSGDSRKLILNPDGTARIELSRGAGTGSGEVWSASWTDVGTSFQLTVERMISRSGAGLNGYFQEGQHWDGRFGTRDGGSALWLSGTGNNYEGLSFCGNGHQSKSCGM